MNWRRVAIIAVGVCAVVPAALALRTWATYLGPAVLRVDYSLYVLSAMQGLREGFRHLYDLEAQRRVFAAYPGMWWFPNVYTPALSVLMVPFTALPLVAGYALWSALMFACLLVCWRLLAPGAWPERWAQLALVLAAFPVQLGLWLGQIVPLEMAAVALCWLALRRGRERTAGALLAVMALKPQGLMLLPFALLAAGKRKLFVTWAACMAAIGLAVLVLIGFDGALAYLERLRYAQSHLAEFQVAWYYSLARRIDEPALRVLAQAAAAGLALFASWRHRERPEIAIAAGLIGSILCTPFVHLQEYMFLFPAGWLLLRAWPRLATAAALAPVYVAMVFGRPWEPGGRQIVVFTCALLVLVAAVPPRQRDAVVAPAAS